MEPLEVKKKIPLRDIMTAVADASGMSIATMLERSRKAHRARARHRVFWFADQLRRDLSFPFVSKQMGYKDHTTSLHGIARINAVLNGGGPDADAERLVLAGIARRLGLTMDDVFMNLPRRQEAIGEWGRTKRLRSQMMITKLQAMKAAMDQLAALAA